MKKLILLSILSLSLTGCLVTTDYVVDPRPRYYYQNEYYYTPNWHHNHYYSNHHHGHNHNPRGPVHNGPRRNR